MDRFDSAREGWDFKLRADVIGAEGDKVGEVVAVESNYIVVQKGFFFPTDYYIPLSAINQYDGDKVYLSVTKEDALNQGWDIQPTGDMVGEDPGYVAGAGANAASTTATAPDADYVESTTYRDPTTTKQTTTTAREHVSDETLRVPVHEEELVASKRARESGEVTISKDVVTEERTLNVPVTEERVRVDWRVPDENAPADAAAFQEGSIEVPVRTEEVVVEKVAHKTGELEVNKETVQHTEKVADQVRRERVRVDDTSGGHTVVDDSGLIEERGAQ